jgi:hypothetical protein
MRAVIPGILSNPVQLRPLDRIAAEQAIRKPVAKWGEEHFGDPKAVEVEDSLVQSLLDQVQQTASGSFATGAGSGSAANLVELPLLQLSLERLWDEEAKADKPFLRLETLNRLEGAPGIVKQHLHRTLEALPAVQRDLTIRLFGHLVTATGGKHAWRADDLAEEIASHRRAARQAAERTIFGRVIARAGRFAEWFSAAGRSFLGAAAAPRRNRMQMREQSPKPSINWHRERRVFCAPSRTRAARDHCSSSTTTPLPYRYCPGCRKRGSETPSVVNGVAQ